MTIVVFVSDGAVPVTVIGYEPSGTELGTVNVRVDEPPVLTEVGAKPAVAPAGSPLADNAIVSALPDWTAVPMLVEPVVPGAAETVEEVEDIEKLLVDAPTDPVIETLSNATLLTWYRACDVTHIPTVAVAGMTSTLVPIRFQEIPSFDCQVVKVLPVRCIFSHLFGDA